MKVKDTRTVLTQFWYALTCHRGVFTFTCVAIMLILEDLVRLRYYVG
jgi:hypothetical protein